MDNRVYLQWNIVNWITVVLMATVGILLVGALASSVRVVRVKFASGATDDGND